MSLTIKQELITPKKASLWLQQNNDNRPLRHCYVEELADALTAKEFKENGETIKFNCDGGLCDGQHRLHAVVKSGVSYRGIVVRGVPRDAFDTIDQVQKRHFSDVLARRGEVYYRHLATAVRAMSLYERGLPVAGSPGMRAAVGVEVLERHPGLRQALPFVHENELNSVTSFGYAAFMYEVCRNLDQQKADEFWSKLGTGESIQRTEPVFLLRKRLIANQAAARGMPRMPRDQVIVFCAKAWNSFRAGKPIKNLRWNANEDYTRFK